MKQYLLSVIQPSEGPGPTPERLAAIMREVYAWRDDVKAAGSWVFGAGLYPPGTATVVRPKVNERDVLITDGPFAEGKEHVGGFTIITAVDLDVALEWARKLSKATTLPIEVRPVQNAEA
jgi:hypothetical protein